MTREQCVEKMREIFKKTGYGYMLISDDPDCECDYGIDAEGYLIVEHKATFLKVHDLENISYYEGGDEIARGYIHFTFLDDGHLYLFYDRGDILGDRIELYINGHAIINDVARKIIHSYNEMWKNKEGFFIAKDGTLLAYVGDEKEIIIPEEVRKIGDYAFYSNKIPSKVVLSENVTEIGKCAFFGDKTLKEIDLKNVEIIGEDAFRGQNLDAVTLPKTLRRIGDGAFDNCNENLIDNIINNSSIVIDERIISVRE